MAELFKGAEAYESTMGRWSVQLAEMFLDFVQLREPRRLLDVGCGTGSLTRAVLARTQATEIVGVDPVEPFIEFARARFNDSRVSFERGDAQQLSHESGSFDHAVSLLVLQFVPDPRKAAAEMRRVTGAGGCVAACTWDRDGMEMGAFFWEEAMKLDPKAEARAQRPRHASQEGDLAEIWRWAGLDDVEETVLDFRMNYASFADYWSTFTSGVAATGAYLNSLAHEQREELRQALRLRLLGGGPDRALPLRAKALAVRGVVPRG